MYKKGTGNEKQEKDAGNRTLCPYRNFSQAITLFKGWCPDDRNTVIESYDGFFVSIVSQKLSLTCVSLNLFFLCIKMISIGLSSNDHSATLDFVNRRRQQKKEIGYIVM